MANSSVDVSDFVSVNVFVSPAAIPYSLFGVPLVINDDNVIDTVQRVRSYSSLQGVATDFGSSSPAYLAAQVFFDQQPQPAQLMVGRWASTSTKGLMHGAVLTPTEQVLSNFTAVTSGAFNLSIDGVPHAINGLNFSACLNLNGVAAIIAAAMPASTNCVWSANNQRFDFLSSTSGVASSVSYGSSPVAIGSVAFSANPAANDTLTIDGTAITFVSASPTGDEVLIGSALTGSTGTLENLLTFLNNSTDTNIAKMTYVSDNVSKIYITSVATGSAGDAYTLAKSSTAITLSGSTLAGGTGTDITGLFGMTFAEGATLVPGIAAESPLAAVQACANASTQWYGAHFAAAGTIQISDHVAIANYILASPRLRIYGVSIYGNALGGTECLDPTQTSDLASTLNTLNNKRVFWMYSSSCAYPAMTMMGRAFTVNFNASKSMYTLAYKQAPGIVGENLTETQFETLQAKGGNVVINVNNGATMIWPGAMANSTYSNGSPTGPFFDEVHGTDWFANRVQTDVFNLLYQTTTKIPQTDDGDNQIVNCLEFGACAAAINNGFAAPGQWNASGFGMLQTGMVLTKGFYVYAPPIASQSQSDREQRKSVPIQIALKLAGAIQQPYLIVNINR